MATTSNFKNQRARRSGVTESSYGLGVKYTNDPLPEGAHKVLVNYDILDRGDSISPRGGFRNLESVSLGPDTKDFITHHVYTAYVDNQVTSDADLVRYELIGPQDVNNLGIKFDESVLIIEDEITGTKYTATLDPGYVDTDIILSRDNSGWSKIHSMDLKAPRNAGIFASVDNQTYVLYDHGGVVKLGQLKLFYDGTHKYTLEEVDPKEISSAEAVNYGYNMLDDDPYTFDNQEGTTALQLLGILPYDPASGDLKFAGLVGESIKFVCNYEWPTSDAGKTYVVQWETKDLSEPNSSVVIQQYVSESADYTPGDEVSLVYKAPFKQFTVIVKFYDKADTSTPLRVMQLPAYYLSADIKGTTATIAPRNYDLGTGTGMAQWNGRLCVWGVKGAETTLFTSVPNQPDYFPFPQGVAVFNEPIVGAITYLDSLMVFTTSQLVRCTLDETYTYIIQEVVQEKLYLSAYDVNTITLVKNMIYFKSNDYFYMIVPKQDLTTINAIQLAPISTPIEYLLDHFEESVREIVSTIYELDVILGPSVDPFVMELQYYYNFLDGDVLRNVYKFKMDVPGTSEPVRYIDFSLDYDTLNRNWRFNINESNDQPLSPYRQYVTDNTIYTNVYKTAGTKYLQYVQQDDDLVVDTVMLDESITSEFRNFPYLDSGYRDQATDTKKRFRELQFRINNIAKVDLEFFTSFFIDDDHRKSFYQYETKQITDPGDPNYGLIYIERTLVDPEFIQGTTALNIWRLGLSQFPDLTVVKIRSTISGKGYSGRLQLLSKNEVKYTLLSHTWVYRLMNMR